MRGETRRWSVRSWSWERVLGRICSQCWADHRLWPQARAEVPNSGSTCSVSPGVLFTTQISRFRAGPVTHSSRMGTLGQAMFRKLPADSTVYWPPLRAKRKWGSQPDRPGEAATCCHMAADIQRKSRSSLEHPWDVQTQSRHQVLLRGLGQRARAKTLRPLVNLWHHLQG